MRCSASPRSSPTITSIDLGLGDGRILIAAARSNGARGFGVDDPAGTVHKMVALPTRWRWSQRQSPMSKSWLTTRVPGRISARMRGRSRKFTSGSR